MKALISAKIIPFNIPIENSLITFDVKLFSVKSLVAIVLTVTANVCIPALPPIDATIGIKNAKTTICSIVAPNKLMHHVAKKAVNKFNTKVIGCKTIRNKNKLALSSRNFLFKQNELNDIEKISKNFLYLKNKIKYSRNINQFLRQTKRDFERFFNIEIEYLENRKINDLSISNEHNGSKIFLAYYFKGVRLIDNF